MQSDGSGERWNEECSTKKTLNKLIWIMNSRKKETVCPCPLGSLWFSGTKQRTGAWVELHPHGTNPRCDDQDTI